MAEYLRKECGDLNEKASDNDDGKDDDNDDDNTNSKNVDVVEIGTANITWKVSKPEIPINRRKKILENKLKIRLILPNFWKSGHL